MRPRATIRLRLTLLYAGLLVACTALLLGMSWWLLGGHLERTLPPAYADAVMRRLAGQYVLGVVGAALVACGLGWALAGHALAPVRRIAATARRVSERRLDERMDLQGPDDELRDLAVTLDEMLDRLQDAMDSQRRFAANASHELRTPLTVIRTEADVTLADPDASAEELRAMGHVVLETTDRMEVLLEGLLLLARGASGGLRDDPVDVAAVARRVVGAAQEDAATAGIRLRLQVEPLSVRGDEVLLERLVSNLVDNAIRHNVRGGFAEVEVALTGERGSIRVANGGAALSPDSLARLAEPFQRLDRSSPGAGSGLGLSIVEAVAEAHGGALRLQPRAGGGLRAEVDLPARVAAEDPSLAPVGASVLIGS